MDEGFYVKEDETDVAERIWSVFAAKSDPSLGIQQLNAIYQRATMSGFQSSQEKNEFAIPSDKLDINGTIPAMREPP